MDYRLFRRVRAETYPRRKVYKVQVAVKHEAERNCFAVALAAGHHLSLIGFLLLFTDLRAADDRTSSQTPHL